MISLIPLGLILGKILVEGLPALSWDFFTTIQPADPFSSDGGISNALVGTLILMGLATLFSAPLGILVALFINDAAASRGPGLRRVGSAVGFVVDVLLGVPSIVAGLIVYLGIVIAMGHFSALAGRHRAGHHHVPDRRPRHRRDPAPGAGDAEGGRLGAGRAPLAHHAGASSCRRRRRGSSPASCWRWRGRRARRRPLLFTSLGNQFFSTNILEPIASLPQLIFRNTVDVRTPQSEQLAWGAALVLVVIILLLNLVARAIAARTRVGGAR